MKLTATIQGLGAGVLTLLLGAGATAQTAPEFHHVQGGGLGGMFFIDSLVGLAAGDGGHILLTDDGGLTWEEAHVADSTEEIRVGLRGIFALDIDHAWCVGGNGVVLAVTPGFNGREWHDANPLDRVTDARNAPLPCGQNKADLYDIYMINQDVGWCCGLDGALAKTTNGGATWFSPWGTSPPPPDFTTCIEDPLDLYALHFFKDGGGYLKGIIASEYRQVITTDDGGDTWTTTNIPEDIVQNGGPALCPHNNVGQNVEFWSVDFEDPLSSTSPGWVVGGYGTNIGFIYRTTAGGQAGTWEQQTCFDFLNPFASPVPTMTCGPSTQYALAVLDSSSPRAVSAGYGGEVYTRKLGTADFNQCPCGPPSGGDPCPGAETWVQADTVSGSLDPCGHKAAFAAGARLSATAACFGGNFDRIVRYDANGGPGGVITETGTRWFLRLFDGDFIDSLNGCVIGQDALVMRTTDGGLSWAVAGPPEGCSPSSQGNGLDFSSTGEYGVAVGTGGFVVRSIDHGVNWTKVSLPPPYDSSTLNAVAFVPGTVDPPVYAVGSQGLVLKSLDQGATWADVSPPGGSDLLGVSFATPTVGYVVGAGPVAYRTTNGGTSWTAVRIPGPPFPDAFMDVATWGNGTSALAVSTGGGVYEKSAFTGFIPVSLGSLAVTETLYDVEVLDDGATVRIGGNNGVVLFRDAGTWTRPRSLTNNAVYKLAFQSATHGFGIGRQCVIREYRP